MGINGDNAKSCFSFATCVADLVYVVTVGPTSIFAYIGSLFLSTGVKLSLTSTAYALDFLTKGWTVMRDVANIAFLFIIIFLAFTIILKADSSGTAPTLALIIVMALLVNFSFFLTRVVIDAGNIAAVQVYNVIPAPFVTDTSGGQKDPTTGNPISYYGCGTATTVTGGSFICDTGMKDLTSVIMAGLNLQNLYSTKQFTEWDKKENWFTKMLTLIALYIATAILLAILGFMFLAAGAKFLTRTVALWFLLMASPLAFAAYAFPYTKSWFGRWRSLLVSNTFYPSVFLFMFLLVTIFMQQACSKEAGGTKCLGILGGIFGDGTGTPQAAYAVGLGINLTAVAIVMGLVIIMVYMAMKVSDKVSVSGAQFTGKLPGWIAGRYAGAIGWAGRNTLGRGGMALSRSEGLRDRASQKGFTGALSRTLLRGSNAAARGSFDTRSAPIGGSILQKAGLGAAGGQGGRRAAVEARVGRREKFAEQLKTGEAERMRRDKAYEAEQKRTTGTTSREKESELKTKENTARREYMRLNETIHQYDVAKARENAGETLTAEEQALVARNRQDLVNERRAANDSVAGFVTAAQEIQKAREAHVSNRDAEVRRLREYANTIDTRKLGNLGLPAEGSRIAAGRIRDKLPIAPIPSGTTPPPTPTAAPATPLAAAPATAPAAAIATAPTAAPATPPARTRVPTVVERESIDSIARAAAEHAAGAATAGASAGTVPPTVTPPASVEDAIEASLATSRAARAAGEPLPAGADAVVSAAERESRERAAAEELRTRTARTPEEAAGGSRSEPLARSLPDTIPPAAVSSEPVPAARSETPPAAPVPHEISALEDSLHSHLTDLQRQIAEGESSVGPRTPDQEQKLRDLHTMSEGINKVVDTLQDIKRTSQNEAEALQKLQQLEGEHKEVARSALNFSKDRIADSLNTTNRNLQSLSRSGGDPSRLEELQRQKSEHEGRLTANDKAQAALGVSTQEGPSDLQSGSIRIRQVLGRQEEGVWDVQKVTSSGFQMPNQPPPGIQGGRTIPETGPEPHGLMGGGSTGRTDSGE